MSDDRTALAELVYGSKLGEQCALLHYLYLPTEADAQEVAGELRQNGFETEYRLSADGVNWLALARHDVVLTEELIGAIRRMMEEFVQPYGGEYDGWEAEMKPEATES